MSGHSEPAPGPGLTGLTWDHPRAYRPLAAYARLGRGPAVRWDRQSLEDFEAHPIAELARRYDLLIVDHPGLGAALAAGALRPLAEVADAATVAGWRAASVAATWRSYELDGEAWAVPVDAATQVMVLRPDLVPRPPRSWPEVVELAGRVPVTLCLGGPHALLGLLGMCASAGGAGPRPTPGGAGPRSWAPAGAGPQSTPGGAGPQSTPGGAVPQSTPAGAGPQSAPGGAEEHLLAPAVAVAAIETLRAVWARSDRRYGLGNPIQVHEAMAGGEVALCPLAYGYASYARPVPGAHALRWADAPTFGTDRPGGVLGGTGLAVSARSGADPDEVRAWLSGYLDPAVQAGLVPDSGGQPATTAAWDRPEVDAAWGGYYSSTRRSLEAAHLRPRINGWISLQDKASELVREAVTAGADAARTVAAINDHYRALTGTLISSEARRARERAV
ncbi:extracellular solute-binding protein [Rugosimonospora acidiphila]|uniref:Extracellular solute-binding protein n=1 Tax=Rugosimonospora acidiphila TaxID=556531 RepID=A0ABP9S1P4_9ACTN